MASTSTVPKAWFPSAKGLPRFLRGTTPSANICCEKKNITELATSDLQLINPLEGKIICGAG